MNYKGILTFFALFSFSGACPDLCTCKWKSGKQTVECVDKGFLAIPEGIDPGTQVLEFSRNNVEALEKELFLNLDLTNLQKIYMSDCGISSIHERTFAGLTNLVELDLSNNLIGAVPTESFVDCPSLMRLTLNSNPIGVVHKAAFASLSFLTTLELRNCEISKVEEGAFQGLHSLEWLHLNGNKLTALQGPRVLPESLKGVELQGNTWQCDCHILDLREWLLTFNVPQTIEPMCNGPQSHKGRSIKLVPTPELACLPDVSPTSFYLELGEGRNVSLLCHVRAIPEATVSWWFRGQMLQNDSLVAPGMRLLYYVDEGGQDKRSELLIFNARTEDNGTYVCNAENFAGRSEANFTVRIVLKEEPVVIIVSFPFEYLMAIVAGAAALALILTVITIASILRCRRNRRRQQKRQQTKEIALHYQQNSSKCADQTADPFKSGEPDVDLQERLFLYEERPGDVSPPLATSNLVSSPASLKRYQLEQNPDLINDAERRREGDGEDNVGTKDCEQIRRFPPYPPDFGLPKLRRPLSEGFYGTLPCSRSTRRQSAANPPTRFAREAEFLTASFYRPDVRYTADGYPARAAEVAPSSLPCCSGQQVQWSDLEADPDCSQSKYANPVNRRCVGAQTESGVEGGEGGSVTEAPAAESPDEGYGGESAVV